MAQPDGEQSKQRFAWCLYDFANSAYPTVIVTFLFGAWYQKALAGDSTLGGTYWAWAMAVSGILVAVVSPLAGYIADHRRGTYRYLVWSTVLVIAGTVALAWAERDPELGHGTPATLLWVLVVVALSNTVFEVGFVFYNAFLPRLVGPEGTGQLSGKGWAFGYVGGLLALAICLALMPGDGATAAETDGAIQGSCLVVAGWFAVFAVPSLWLLRNAPVGAPRQEAAATSGGLGASMRGLRQTLRRLPQHRDLLALLVARLIYNDAVIAVISLAALYMGGTLGMGFEQILIVGIGLNVLAGAGAFGFGFVDDRVGGRTTVLISLVMLLAGTVLALSVPTVEAFYGAAALIGIALGPNQAASRSLLGRFVPPARAAEFYGLFALSGKATVWVGPALFGVILQATGSQRWALAPLAVMLLIGFLLLLRVDERRGVAHAEAMGAEPVP